MLWRILVLRSLGQPVRKEYQRGRSGYGWWGWWRDIVVGASVGWQWCAQGRAWCIGWDVWNRLMAGCHDLGVDGSLVSRVVLGYWCCEMCSCDLSLPLCAPQLLHHHWHFKILVFALLLMFLDCLTQKMWTQWPWKMLATVYLSARCTFPKIWIFGIITVITLNLAS
jgi:hypothetical protein